MSLWRSLDRDDVAVNRAASARGSTPRPRVSIPLARLALCSDCDHAYELGGSCPTCGSDAFALVTSFLREDPEAARLRALPWAARAGSDVVTLVCVHETPHRFDPPAHEGEYAFRAWLRWKSRRFCPGDYPAWLVPVWAASEILGGAQ